MKKYFLTTFLIVLTGFILASGYRMAFNSAPPPGSQPVILSITTQEISMEEAVNFWKEKKALFIDVRTPEEYSQGHIPGAILIPLDELDKRVSEVPKDKKVLIICRSGARSAKANFLLQEHGFTNTVSVKGGMSAWPEKTEK